MKRAVFIVVMLAALLLATTTAAMAQDEGGFTVPVVTETYTVPVTIDDVTTVLTMTVKGSNVLSVTGHENVEVGEPQRVESAPASTKTLTSSLTIQVNVPEFPAGADGEVDAVFLGPYKPVGSGNTSVGVVIRNNTDTTIYDPSLSAEAYDAEGNLLGFGDEVLPLLPLAVEPGQISVGRLYFDGMEVTESDTIEVTIEYDDEYDSYREYSVAVDQVGRSQRSRGSLIGTISNPNNVTIDVYEVVLLCFDGRPGETYTDDGEFNVEVLEPGESAPFQVVSDCESYILSASGFED